MGFHRDRGSGHKSLEPGSGGQGPQAKAVLERRLGSEGDDLGQVQIKLHGKRGDRESSGQPAGETRMDPLSQHPQSPEQEIKKQRIDGDEVALFGLRPKQDHRPIKQKVKLVAGAMLSPGGDKTHGDHQNHHYPEPPAPAGAVNPRKSHLGQKDHVSGKVLDSGADHLRGIHGLAQI